MSIYPGKWNDIITRREYFQDFKCNFDLSYYPFDVQTCFMNFTLIGTMDTQVILRKDKILNLTYLGEKRLVEYQVSCYTILVKPHHAEINFQVENVTLEVESVTKSGFSTASVIVTLKRLKVYYYLNVFLQFGFLICIGFMSLTFPVNNFSDRVMTALTVLLVMTCNQQVINVSFHFESHLKQETNHKLSWN